MNANWPPYQPPSAPPPGISVGGNGIHIHTHTNGPVPNAQMQPSVDHVTGFSKQTQSWVTRAQEHRGAAVLGLGLGGFAVLMFSFIGWAFMGLPLFFLFGPALAGIGMVLGAGYVAVAKREAQPVLTADVERRLLALAKSKGGVVTVSDVALHLHVSLAQAEEALGEILHSGHVDIDNDPETGAVIYVFRDWAPALPAAQR